MEDYKYTPEDLKILMDYLESSHGVNLEHETSNYGLQKGHKAFGRHGLMPNTVLEMANRRRLSNQADELDKQILKTDPKKLEDKLNENPELYDRYTSTLAEHTLNRAGGDINKAAAGWLYGHNLSPERMQKALDNDPEYKKRILEGIKYNKIGQNKPVIEPEQMRIPSGIENVDEDIERNMSPSQISPDTFKFDLKKMLQRKK